MDDTPGPDESLTTPPRERGHDAEVEDTDEAPASGAAGGSGPPGVGEGNAGIGVETEGMPDPPEETGEPS